MIIAKKTEIQMKLFVWHPNKVEYLAGTVSSRDLPITILSHPPASPNKKRPIQIVGRVWIYVNTAAKIAITCARIAALRRPILIAYPALKLPMKIPNTADEFISELYF